MCHKLFNKSRIWHVKRFGTKTIISKIVKTKRKTYNFSVNKLLFFSKREKLK